MKAIIDIKDEGLDISLTRYGNDNAIAYLSYRGDDVSYTYEIDLRAKTIVVSHVHPKDGVTFEQAYGLNCVHGYSPCQGVNVQLYYDLANSTLNIVQIDLNNIIERKPLCQTKLSFSKSVLKPQ